MDLDQVFVLLFTEAAAASVNLSSTPPPGQYLKGGDSEWKLLGSDLSRCESDEHILSRNSSKACLTVQGTYGPGQRLPKIWLFFFAWYEKFS